MTEYERKVKEIAQKIFKIQFPDLDWGHSGTMDDDSWRRFEQQCLWVAAQILSLKGIEIRADDQSLPFSYGHYNTMERTQQEFLKPDKEGRVWKKVIPQEV